MSRGIDADLKQHLGLPVTNTALLWKITLVDTTEHLFTSHDADIEYPEDSGDIYKSAYSASVSALNQSALLSVDTMDFDMILESNNISESDLRGGKFDNADVKIYLVNYMDISDGVCQLARGILGEVQIIDDYRAKVEFRSLTQLTNQIIGRIYQPECDADLGDSRCGVTIATYTETGTLTGVTDNRIFADSGRSEADDYFNYGVLTWTSGNNNGLSKEVKDFTNSTGTFELVAPMPFTVQVGDTYSVYRGCDKTAGTCKDAFSNLDNFRGHPYIPGLDQMLKYPDAH